MEFVYRGRVWLDELRGANGEFASASDVMENVMDSNVTEDIKKDEELDQNLRDAIISVENSFDGYDDLIDYVRDNEEEFEKYRNDDYDEEDYDEEDEWDLDSIDAGNEGYWRVEIVTNRKLTDEEICALEDWYRNGDYFWINMFEDIEFSL